MLRLFVLCIAIAVVVGHKGYGSYWGGYNGGGGVGPWLGSYGVGSFVGVSVGSLGGGGLGRGVGGRIPWWWWCYVWPYYNWVHCPLLRGGVGGGVGGWGGFGVGGFSGFGGQVGGGVAGYRYSPYGYLGIGGGKKG